jgi:glucose-1-phosphate thymidylyltransferase
VNAILLAAGYATRLYPLTRDRPKPLLPVGGRPILDYLVERLDEADEIDRMVVVTNDKFAGHFEGWASSVEIETPLEVINDGTRSNDDRLGAVGDVNLTLERAGLYGQPAYVLATDNLPKFDLLDILYLSRERGASAVFALPVPDRCELTRMGVADVNEDGRIVSFEEKPAEPKGEYRVPPFYCYTADAVDAVPQYLAEGNNPDAPGHFLAWLVKREPVYAARPGVGTWDIGTLESYRRVQEDFKPEDWG